MTKHSHVLGREPGRALPIAVGGEGCYLFDESGHRYLDASGGAAVSNLGHQHPHVVAALHAQLDRLIFAHTAFFTSSPAETLAARLCAHAPTGLDQVFLVSGGSEAVEAAIKIARQYRVETGSPQRYRLVSRRQSYHGSTMGALAAGGNRSRRRAFAQMLVDTSQVAPCFAYRGQHEGESAVAYGERAANELESEIKRLGADSVLAFIAEPVVGATAGAVPPVPGYFARIREICDRYGVLLILDEVMCGMGRTGTLFACTQEGIVPDLVCLAKGLGGGYQPLGAVLCSSRIGAAIAAGSGVLQHSHTYQGHALAATCGNAVLEVLLDTGLLEQVTPRGTALDLRLRTALGTHPHVGDIRGRGLLRGIEIVADRKSKAPFDPNLRIHARIKRAAFEAGVLCYPGGGTIDGKRGDHVLIAPPFIIDENQLDVIVDALAGAIDAAVYACRNG